MTNPQIIVILLIEINFLRKTDGTIYMDSVDCFGRNSDNR
jgi:hypothetical protein